jgi:preprotein translocase subunit SecF
MYLQYQYFFKFTIFSIIFYLSFHFYVKNYYIIILISFLFYFNFKVSISFLKQLGLRQTKKAKSNYTTSLMKKQKPKAHKKTQTGVDKNAKCRVEVQTEAGHKKKTTLTQNISRSKSPSPYKNSNWSRQNRKV